MSVPVSFLQLTSLLPSVLGGPVDRFSLLNSFRLSLSPRSLVFCLLHLGLDIGKASFQREIPRTHGTSHLRPKGKKETAKQQEPLE